MTSLYVVIVIGLLGGLAAGLQGPLSSVMGKEVGIFGSVFIVHLGGTVVSALSLLVPGTSNLGAWRNVPWYALGAGALGLMLVGALSFCIPRIGAVATIAIIIGAQLTLGVFLDHFGILVESVRPIDASRVAGIGVLFLGVWLVMR